MTTFLIQLASVAAVSILIGEIVVYQVKKKYSPFKNKTYEKILLCSNRRCNLCRHLPNKLYMSVMSTTPFTPEQLFVHDATTWTNGHRTGTLDIKNKADRHAKWIADVKPYGGTFPDYEEAKAYAKLFAASPDLLDALRKWVGDYEAYRRNEPVNQKNMEAIYKEALAAIEKATT